jgi:hypothetical protein
MNWKIDKLRIGRLLEGVVVASIGLVVTTLVLIGIYNYN